MKHLKDQPELQEFHIEGVKHIAPSDAFELLKNNEAILIDVREQEDLKYEQIPLDNVLYYPMTTIVDKLDYISKEQNIILICPEGKRSTKVANFLIINQYPNVANVDGGFLAWKKQGLPFETKLNFTGGCSCNSEQSSGCCSGGSCC